MTCAKVERILHRKAVLTILFELLQAAHLPRRAGLAFERYVTSATTVGLDE
jgi:hypothetical protein